MVEPRRRTERTQVVTPRTGSRELSAVRIPVAVGAFAMFRTEPDRRKLLVTVNQGRGAAGPPQIPVAARARNSPVRAFQWIPKLSVLLHIDRGAGEGPERMAVRAG